MTQLREVVKAEVKAADAACSACGTPMIQVAYGKRRYMCQCRVAIGHRAVGEGIIPRCVHDRLLYAATMSSMDD